MAPVAGACPQTPLTVFIDLPNITFVRSLGSVIAAIMAKGVAGLVEFVYSAKPGGNPDIVFKVPGNVSNKVAADRARIRGMNIFGEFVFLPVPEAQPAAIRPDPEV